MRTTFRETVQHGHRDILAGAVQVRRLPNGHLRIITGGASQRDRDQTRQGLGQQSRGDICVRTTLQVVAHNASQVPPRAGECYRWTGYDVLLETPAFIDIAP